MANQPQPEVPHGARPTPATTPQHAVVEPRRSTTFFRIMNFELFAHHQNPVTKVFTYVGSSIFIGIIGYFMYKERQAKLLQLEKQEQEEEE